MRASGCGSIILASLILKIGSVGFYKFYYIFFNNFKNLSNFFFSLVVFRSFILVIIILRFFDLKYLVACSSIIHIAPIFPLCCWGERGSTYSCMLMMVGHGLVSYFIFFLVRLIYERSYNRSVDFNKRLNSSSSIFFIFIFFFFLLNIGFPPFCRFISELIFLHSYSLLRVSLCFLFCLILILRGLLFFFVLRKSLFGKKIIFYINVLNLNIYIYSLIYLFFFFSIPLIYF